MQTVLHDVPICPNLCLQAMNASPCNLMICTQVKCKFEVKTDRQREKRARCEASISHCDYTVLTACR